MAVDFSLLPQEETHQDEAPSRFVWTIAFFLMVLAGVFAVLLLWPKDVPTQTWKFWMTLTLFPVGIPTWIVLRRYSVYEGRKLDTEMHNEAVREFNTRVLETASLPLAVLGAAHRISSDLRENAPEHIAEGAVTLKAENPIAKHGDVVKARWIRVPGMQSTPGGKQDDLRRRHCVTKWLFDQLLDDLSPCLQGLPARLPLTVYLSIDNGFTPKQNEALWLACWNEKTSRSAAVTHPTTSPADLMILDRWMDTVIGDEDMHATLIVAIQLNPLLAETPSPGTAEAGVALVLAPDTLANQYSISRQRDLHRPVRGAADPSTHALKHAMQWANAIATRITTAWQTGLDAMHAGALREPAKKLALDLRVTDLDQTVGHAGVAAPWLALACAASAPCGDSTAQFVFVGEKSIVDCAVLKHTNVGQLSTLAVPDATATTDLHPSAFRVDKTQPPDPLTQEKSGPTTILAVRNTLL